MPKEILNMKHFGIFLEQIGYKKGEWTRIVFAINVRYKENLKFDSA